MPRPWEADPSADFAHRLGRAPGDLGVSGDKNDCPDIWRLTNGDVAVIGRDLTHAYTTRLPTGVALGEDERLVVIPAATLAAARPDIADV